MSDSFLDEGLDDNLDADTGGAPQSDPAPQPDPQPGVDAAPQPDPTAAPPPPPEPAAPAPPAPEPASPPPGFVPVAVSQEEREKRQAAERERDELRRQLQARTQPAAEPAAIPDPVVDPEGWDAHQRQQAEAVQWNAVTTVSQLMANQTYGEEAVKAATAAYMAEAASKPWLVQELRQQQHPYDYVVRRQKQAEVAAKLGEVDLTEFEQFRAWKAMAPAGPGGAPPTPPAAPAAAPPAPAPARPPPSLASQPSAGGIATEVVEDPFDAEFRRKK